MNEDSHLSKAVCGCEIDPATGADQWLNERCTSASGSSKFAYGSDPSATETRRIAVLTLMQQPLSDGLAEFTATKQTTEGEAGRSEPTAATIAIRIHGSIPDLARAISKADEEYVVFSPRPGLVWDLELLRRVEREIVASEELSPCWFCLSADGMDIEERQYSAAFFNYEPTLVPDRGRRLIVQTAGTMYVVKVSAFRSLGLQSKVIADVVHWINNLVVIAYARGFGSFFASGLYPCLTEHRCKLHTGLENQLLTLNPSMLLDPLDAAELFPAAVPRRTLLAAWVETLSSVLVVKHSFSFVIRTLFRRSHMLRRCLISIEYLRSSLNFPVEIVLASDADEVVIKSGVDELVGQFPNLNFVVAHGGAGKGHSRVRNLIAGLQTSSGARVCIIDDDDYYTPQAISGFAQACDFGTEWLIIFDTQIIIEKWLTAGVKQHKEIVAYGHRFDSKSWTTTLRGSNSIPLCGLIHPGWFVRQVAQEYRYDFDLSEDFVFHLMCFAHPKRPPIKVIEGVGAHQSHRNGDDNVSNVEDRTRWVSDTGNGLYQLLFEKGRTFDVISGSEAQIGEVSVHERLAVLEADASCSAKAQARAVELLATLIDRTAGGAPAVNRENCKR